MGYATTFTYLNTTQRGTFTKSNPLSSEKNLQDAELAIFKSHRHAFFFWVKWTNMLKEEDLWFSPPTLVTIDWHRDLAPPSVKEKEELQKLDQYDLTSVRKFAQIHLDRHNDDHILSAIWLNLIGDVILLKNYGKQQSETYYDLEGHKHNIFECENFEVFQDELIARNDANIYLDIDLDYFIINKVFPFQRKEVQVYNDENIRQIMKPDNKLFKYLFKKLRGITIATEPRYCGGVKNSEHILEVVLGELLKD